MLLNKNLPLSLTIFKALSFRFVILCEHQDNLLPIVERLTTDARLPVYIGWQVIRHCRYLDYRRLWSQAPKT